MWQAVNQTFSVEPFPTSPAFSPPYHPLMSPASTLSSCPLSPKLVQLVTVQSDDYCRQFFLLILSLLLRLFAVHSHSEAKTAKQRNPYFPSSLPYARPIFKSISFRISRNMLRFLQMADEHFELLRSKKKRKGKSPHLANNCLPPTVFRREKPRCFLKRKNGEKAIY